MLLWKHLTAFILSSCFLSMNCQTSPALMFLSEYSKMNVWFNLNVFCFCGVVWIFLTPSVWDDLFCFFSALHASEEFVSPLFHSLFSCITVCLSLCSECASDFSYRGVCCLTFSAYLELSLSAMFKQVYVADAVFISAIYFSNGRPNSCPAGVRSAPPALQLA